MEVEGHQNCETRWHEGGDEDEFAEADCEAKQERRERSGEALSNVIITRLPFAVPDSPLIEAKRELPDYLPARMVNEFAYCPRLFFYEWVEGLFAESVDTIKVSSNKNATQLPPCSAFSASGTAGNTTISGP